MKRESQGSLLSTVFVDYDNIYLSLKRKNAEAAKRFAKESGLWLSAIANGTLITPTNGPDLGLPRRIVMNRCYGNSVPRRNDKDNATDMNSFPFVRHHFVRAGFEVIDCPPLTAQLKNSADIRMVMDVRDYLLHDTYFDEFVIMSADADFTPVLHRLRQHARRTVVYANDYTVAPYRAISDGEIREADLIALLLEGVQAPRVEDKTPKTLPSPASLAAARSEIIGAVLHTVRSAHQPVPLEALADRAVRELGHEKTVGLAWGGAGSFRDLLLNGLPDDVRMSDAAPYFVYDTTRQSAPEPLRAETREAPRALPSADSVREAQAQLARTEDPAAWNRGLAAEPGSLTASPASQQVQPERPAAQAPAAQQPAPMPQDWNRQPAQAFEAPEAVRPDQPAPGQPMAQPQQAQPYQSQPAAFQQAAPVEQAREPVRTLEANREQALHQNGHPNGRQDKDQNVHQDGGRIEPRLPQPQSFEAPRQPDPQPLRSHVAPPTPATAAPTLQRDVPAQPHQPRLPEPAPAPTAQVPAPAPVRHVPQPQPAAPVQQQQVPAAAPQPAPQAAPAPTRARAPASPAPAAPSTNGSSAGALQAAIARIHEACQAPPLSPPEYRVLFQSMAEEINDNGLTGSATLINIAQRAQDHGVEVRRDDVRFVLEVVSEADPWFEQGASAALFAGRFRNFVVARCRSQGLQLTADELDLIEAWFSSGAPRNSAASRGQAAATAQAPQPAQPEARPQAAPAGTEAGQGDGGWFGTGATGTRSDGHPTQRDDDFPRILQKRARG